MRRFSCHTKHTVAPWPRRGSYRQENQVLYNSVMDRALDRSLKHLLSGVLLGKNPTEASAKGSPPFVAAVMLCLEQHIREQCCSRSTHATTPHNSLLLVVPWGEKVIHKYTQDSGCGWGWVQILPKAVITEHLLLPHCVSQWCALAVQKPTNSPISWAAVKG